MEPQDLLAHANALLRRESGRPKQITLRRAISASYYSVFHTFLRCAADDLIGTSHVARQSVAYRMVYRAFEHRDMKSLCEDAVKPNLPKKLREAIGRAQFSGCIRVAATNFIELQRLRHLADYDPHYRLSKSDAETAIERAKTAIVFVKSEDKEERRLFLLSMLFQPR